MVAQLLPHLVHAGPLVPAERMIGCLVAAENDAFARRADVKAHRFLNRALALVSGNGGVVDGATHEALPALLLSAARAKERLGARAEARALLLQALDRARCAADVRGEAAIERRIGLVALHGGESESACAHLKIAEERARSGGHLDIAFRTCVARAMALQAAGRATAARVLISGCIPKANALGDAGTSARVHRAMALLCTWSGPSTDARGHGAIALRHAEASGDKGVAWSVHWALSLVAGRTGDAEGVRRHQDTANRLAGVLQSPIRRAWATEIGIEYACATGHLEDGLRLAESVLPIARALAPKTLLLRLLVWTGLIQLERDETTEAHRQVQEAWALAGADGDSNNGGMDVTGIVPAAIGIATYHLRERDWASAARFAERGLAIADRLGMTAWAIHRLLPLLTEAQLALGEVGSAELTARRLRVESQAFGHPLGLAFADAADALLRHFRDREKDAYQHVLAAADRMEGIPFLFPSVRLRVMAARLLAEDGRGKEAVPILRAAHEALVRMGATRELRLVREVPGSGAGERRARRFRAPLDACHVTRYSAA